MTCHMLYDSVDMKSPEQECIERHKVDQWLSRVGSREGEWTVTANGYRFLFRLMKMF